MNDVTDITINDPLERTGLCSVREAVRSMREFNVTKMELAYIENGTQTNVYIEILPAKEQS